MTLPVTDNQRITRLFEAATALQIQASLYSAQADDGDVTDYLQEFANDVEDAMADSLTPAERALERNERLRDVDPKARRANMPVETESPA